MKLTTKQGHDFFLVSSAFQKAIRQGDEETALYFMVELFNSGYDEYTWKRIKTIVSEDIGLAEPNLPANIAALYQFYSEVKKEAKDNRPERMFLTHAVLALSRANKSRLVDWNLIKIWREHEEKKLPIPDYAYDMHNIAGKQMGRGLDHFYNEGTRLHPYSPQDGEIEAKTKAYEIHRRKPGKPTFEKAGKMQQSINFDSSEI